MISDPQSRGPSLTIHSRLTLLVLATAVPLIAFALGLVLWHSNTEQRLLRAQASRTASAAMQAVDRELSGVIAGLQVLAASPDLAHGDFNGFHAQAQAAVGIAGNSVIILYDRDGNRLVSSAAAYGVPLPRRADMSAFTPPFTTGKPHVTPLFISETVKQPTVGVVVPVFVNGEVKYVLGAGILSQRLSNLLVTSGLPVEWVAALLDQDGTIIARTRNPRGVHRHEGDTGRLATHAVRAGRRRHGAGRDDAAEPDVVGDAEDLHRQLEFTQPVRPEVVVLVRRQMGEILDEHLALLAEGAGDQTDGRALGHILGHRRPVVDRLVIGMGMDQHEPPGGLRRHIRSHGPTLCRAARSLRG